MEQTRDCTIISETSTRQEVRVKLDDGLRDPEGKPIKVFNWKRRRTIAYANDQDDIIKRQNSLRKVFTYMQ